MNGNHNKFLDIDLTSKIVNVKSIDPDLLKLFVGGSTLAARLFYDMKGHEYEPLSPESPFFIMTGPLVGTNFPGSSRFTLSARSPLTGIWGETASGGSLGASLKMAGFDGIIITGRSEYPCYILIEDDEVSIEDASDLRGKDTYDTIDYLKERYGGKPKAHVMTIGPAGENLVKFASVCNDKGHFFGRTGMGAVMGSKNLKAVVARGTGRVPLADAEVYKTVRKKTLDDIKESMISQSFHELGTAAAMDLGMMTGDVPIKNWSVGVDYDMGSRLGGTTMVEDIVTKRASCHVCPIACKPIVVVDDPKYKVDEGPGPEYETLGTLGTMLMNDNLNAVARANEIVNRLGLDSISIGATISYMMEAYEKGFISPGDLDGLELTWGNSDAIIEMIEKIAFRQGFGDRAAEGSRALAQSLGQGAMDFLVEIKGLEPPMHDPRGFHGMALAYMMSNRGACHVQHSAQAVEQGMVSWNELGLKDDYPAHESEGKAEVIYISENIGQMGNALCVCHFVHWAMGNMNLLDGLNAVCGLDFGLEDLVEAGKRSWVLKRAINNLMGVTERDDRLPVRMLTPLSDGGSEGTVPDVGLLKSEYYKIRGLDEKGFPTAEILDSLDLGFIKERLNR